MSGYGLSPLARGTPARTMAGSIPIRFIPAGAGNTDPARLPRLVLAVYPRWRGEHLIATQAEVEAYGLSPLARGTPLRHFRGLGGPRFIPAGAGNTRPGVRAFGLHPVYPRWRGEHAPILWPVREPIGLSPLARGTPLARRLVLPLVRFIPAGAGNTRYLMMLAVHTAVYPRWRGEHTKKIDFNINSF